MKLAAGDLLDVSAEKLIDESWRKYSVRREGLTQTELSLVGVSASKHLLRGGHEDRVSTTGVDVDDALGLQTHDERWYWQALESISRR